MLSRREFRLPVDLVNFLAKLGVARNEILCKCNCICNPFYCNLMIFCECICSIEVFAESIVRAKCFCGTNNTELPVGDVRRQARVCLGRDFLTTSVCYTRGRAMRRKTLADTRAPKCTDRYDVHCGCGDSGMRRFCLRRIVG